MSRIKTENGDWKITPPKISPGAYIFSKTLFEGLIFGGAYERRKICASKLIGLAYSWKEIYRFCFVLLGI